MAQLHCLIYYRNNLITIGGANNKKRQICIFNKDSQKWQLSKHTFPLNFTHFGYADIGNGFCAIIGGYNQDTSEKCDSIWIINVSSLLDDTIKNPNKIFYKLNTVKK